MKLTSNNGPNEPTYIGELDRSQLAQIRKTIMSCIFIDNEGDVLHWLGTEPFRHFVKVAAAQSTQLPQHKHTNSTLLQ